MTGRVDHSGSRFNRALWAAVLLAAIGLVVANFVSQPTSGAALQAFSPHMTLWVTNAQADPQAENVAQALTGYWVLGRSESTVGVLPGASAAAVDNFVTGAESGVQARQNLLVMTSTTLAEVAPAGGGHPPVTRAPLVAVFASDPLEIAVSRSSPIHSTAQLRAALESDPGQKQLAVADSQWMTGNLAALVTDLGLHVRLPYTSLPNSASAIAGLTHGSATAILAPRSSLLSALHRRQVRLIGWPGPAQPRAWVALVASDHVSAQGLARLRTRARELYRKAGWRRLLHAQGLTPLDPSSAALSHFLSRGVADAKKLQALAARVIQS